MTVRTTTAEDEAPIIRLCERGGVFKPEEIGVVKELLGIYLRQPGQSAYQFFSADEGGAIVGFACCGPTSMTTNNFELYWIATDKNALRGGIGSALLRAVEAEARTARRRWLNIVTSSTEPYAPARAFYERHGYAPVTRIADYYAEGDDLIWYRKALA